MCLTEHNCTYHADSGNPVEVEKELCDQLERSTALNYCIVGRAERTATSTAFNLGRPSYSTYPTARLR